MTKKPNLVLVDQFLTIRCPIDDVFRYISNHENYINWFPGVVSIHAIDNKPHGTLGKIYHETLKLPLGRKQLIAIKVIASQTPDLFITEGTFAPIFPRMEIHLKKKSDQETSLHLKFLSRSQSTFWRLIVQLVVHRTFKRQSSIGLQQLKKILET